MTDRRDHEEASTRRLDADRTEVIGAPGRGEDPPGARVGRFSDLVFLARGGMGTVVEAIDPEFGRSVALKVIDRAGGTPGGRDPLDEARITGRLEHPNIVPVHELGRTDDGRPWFAMKLVRGRSLSEALAAPDRPGLARLLADFLKVCDAVAFAHSRRIVHRDLKPANVMVGEFGEVLVMDWGLAKRLDDRTRGHAVDSGRLAAPDRTMDGTILGTLAYMPPEQARGAVDEIDERSDVYSLGAILYEILTLAPPFGGAKVDDVLERIRRGAFESPTNRAPDRKIPAELEAVVLKAMARRSADRYASVPELQAEIQAYLEGRPLQTARYSIPQRVWKWSRRHPTASMAALSAAIVAAILLAVGWRALAREREATRQAGEALARAEASLVGSTEPSSGEDALRRSLDAHQAALAHLERALAHRPLDPDLRSRRDAVAGEIARIEALVEAELREEERRLGEILEGIRTGRHGEQELDELVLEAAGFSDALVERILDAHGLAPLREKAAVADHDPWTEEERNVATFACRVLAGHDPAIAAPLVTAWLDLADDARLVAEAVRALLTLHHRDLAPAIVRLLVLQDSAPAIRRAVLREVRAARRRGWRADWRAWPAETPEELTERARCQIASGDLPGALEDLGRALAAGDWVPAYLQRATIRLERAEAALALQDLDRAIERDPGDGSAHMLRARASILSGRVEQAIEDAERALELDPGDVAAIVLRAEIERATGHAEEAAEALDRALRLDPKRPDAHRLAGLLAEERGDTAAARDAFERALAIDPFDREALQGVYRCGLAIGTGSPLAEADAIVARDPEQSIGYYLRARALSHAGDAAGAAREIERALRIDPDDLDARCTKARMLAASGRQAEGLALLDEVLTWAPERAGLILGHRAMARRESGDLPGALEDFDRALAAPGAPPWVALQRSGTRYAAGDRAAAIEDLARFLAARPFDADGHVTLARWLLELGRLDEAVIELESAIAVRPSMPEVWLLRGQARFQRRDIDGSVEDLLEAVRLAPSNGRARAALGVALSARGQWAEAAAHLGQALQILGEDPKIRLARAIAHHQLEAWQESLDDVDRAIEGGLGGPDVWNQRGIALAGLGRVEEALAEFDRAVQAAPGDAAAYINRANVRLDAGRMDGVAEDVATIERLAPGLPRVDYLKARVAKQEGRMADALDLVDRFLAAVRDNGAGQELRADILRILGRAEEARESCRRALVLRDRPALRLLAARIHLDLGDAASAAEDATAALAGRPDSVEALEVRAEAFHRMGRIDPAIGDLARITAISPGNWGAWLRYGDLAAARDRPQEALRAWREGRERAPTEAKPEFEARIRKAGGR